MSERGLSARVWRVPEDDSELLARLQEIGLLDQDRVETIEIDAAEDAEGRPPCLFAIQRNWVSAHQLRRLSNSLTRLLPTCYKCLKRSAVERADFDGRYECSKCGEEVSFADGSAGLAEALLPLPTARMVDSIFEQYLIKREGLAKAQLEAILQLRKTRVPRPTLPQLVVDCVLLDEERAQKLKRRAERVCKQRLDFWNKLVDDAELARFLVLLAVAGQGPVSEALLVQLDAAMRGEYYPLRDLLCENGELLPSQLARWLPGAFDDKVRREVLLAPLQALFASDDDDSGDDWDDEDSDDWDDDSGDGWDDDDWGDDDDSVVHDDSDDDLKQIEI